VALPRTGLSAICLGITEPDQMIIGEWVALLDDKLPPRHQTKHGAQCSFKLYSCARGEVHDMHTTRRGGTHFSENSPIRGRHPILCIPLLARHLVARRGMNNQGAIVLIVAAPRCRRLDPGDIESG